MLLLVLLKATCAALRPLRPVEKMVISTGPLSILRVSARRPKTLGPGSTRRHELPRPHGPDGPHDGYQLLGIVRVCGITALLQGSGRLGSCASLGDRGIAWVGADKRCVVGECLLKGVVDTEGVPDLLALTANHFVRNNI